jgi:hypothetical protein
VSAGLTPKKDLSLGTPEWLSPDVYIGPNSTSIAHTTSAKVTSINSNASSILAARWVAAQVATYNWSKSQYTTTVSATVSNTFPAIYVPAAPSTPFPSLVYSNIHDYNFVIKWYLSNPSNANFNPNVEPLNAYRIAVLYNTTQSEISGVAWSNVPTMFSKLWAYGDIGVPSPTLDISNTGYTFTVSSANIRTGASSNYNGQYYAVIVEAYNAGGNTYATSVGSTPAVFWQ